MLICCQMSLVLLVLPVRECMSHSALRWQVSYREALAAIFIEGWIFIFLSLVGVRQALVRLLPRTLALAMSAGIGKCSTLCCSALHPDSITCWIAAPRTPFSMAHIYWVVLVLCTWSLCC